jgi:uncharacterized protein
MLGTLNTTQIEEVLHSEVIGRIGCHNDGTTYIVPISYGYDGTYIYARSTPGMKIDIMRKNPKICFEVEALKDMGNWQTVILWGEFEEITNTDDRKAALQFLLQRQLPIVTSEMVKFTPNWPFKPNDLNSIDGVVYKINITKKTGRFENHDEVSEGSKAFH